MLARMRKSMKEKDQGFTLIELLVVMIIIGILAAIAIPIFLNQRKKAVDASVKSDLKAAASAIEDWAVDNPTLAVPAVAAVSSATTPAANVSNGNTIQIIPGGTVGQYCIKGSNSNSNAVGGAVGTGVYFVYASDAGGLQPGKPTASGPGVCAGK
jgi:type IV pilus assembly protein PilA